MLTFIDEYGVSYSRDFQLLRLMINSGTLFNVDR